MGVPLTPVELLGAGEHEGDDYQNIRPKLAKRLRLASSLPPHDLKALVTFIDALLLKQQIKEQGTGRQMA